MQGSGGGAVDFLAAFNSGQSFQIPLKALSGGIAVDQIARKLYSYQL